MNKQTTAWLERHQHPCENVPFSLPAAIYFLLKFRPDLESFDCHTVRGRMLIYFWWKAHGTRDYPDFNWILREQDLNYLQQFGAETLLTEYPECIALWLRNRGPDVLNQRALLAGLMQFRNLELTELVGFPRFLDIIVDSRPDLRQAFDLSTFHGQVAAMQWWDITGHHEYPRLNWLATDMWAKLNDYRPHAEIKIPQFLTPMLISRDDFPATMPYSSAGALIDAANWWERAGYQEYSNLCWNTEAVWSYFSEVDKTSNEHSLLPRFARVLLNHRADLETAFKIDNLADQFVFFQWWNNHGRNEYPRLSWNMWDSLLTTGKTDCPEKPALPRFLATIWLERQDLQSMFSLDTFEGTAGLVKWWHTHGKNEYDFLNTVDIHFDNEVSSFYAKTDLQTRLLPYGVNVIGFPQGMLGLGEDARLAAIAIETLSVPVVLVNAPMSGPIKRIHSEDRLLSERLRYGINLFCLPPPEIIRLALEGGRNIIESNTYNIGAWPWELPRWPRAFGTADDLVDEIWAQSRYVESVYGQLGRKPVFHMPMVVEIPKPTNPDRKRFGLPEGDFLFYLMFDGNSWLTRKNPLAGVLAFQKAFGSDTERVSLVVKAMNVRTDDPAWQSICKIADKESSRITVVTENLNRQDSIDFMAACDAYISLHRAEGFGRVIAEAMLLEQPVVTTNFSGNVDFCTKKTSYLVDGELIPLGAKDYLFQEGQYWCDPDIGIAATQLRQLFENPNERTVIAKAGQAMIVNNYSLRAVSSAYKQRIDTVFGRN